MTALWRRSDKSHHGRANRIVPVGMMTADTAGTNDGDPQRIRHARLRQRESSENKRRAGVDRLLSRNRWPLRTVLAFSGLGITNPLLQSLFATFATLAQFFGTLTTFARHIITPLKGRPMVDGPLVRVKI
jgi:hypothetical protein